MLVLTRKTKQAIKIGGNIEITILAIEGDQVKIGIDAPRTIEVHRKEIFDEIQLQNSEAANVPAELLSTINKLYNSDNKN